MTWASVVKYRFSGAAMGEDDRLLNPLGFQVIRYHRDAEILPEPASDGTLQVSETTKVPGVPQRPSLTGATRAPVGSAQPR